MIEAEHQHSFMTEWQRPAEDALKNSEKEPQVLIRVSRCLCGEIELFPGISERRNG